MPKREFLVPAMVVELERDPGSFGMDPITASGKTHVAWVAGDYQGTRVDGTFEDDALARLRSLIANQFRMKSGRRGKRIMLSFEEEDARDVLES